MSRYLRFEIAQARPPQPFVQIDFGHNHGPPLFGVNELIARVIINGGEHPLARDVLVSAADEVYVIFAGARRGQQLVATPHRPRDHFGAVVAQSPRYFRKEAVITDHHTYPAESRVEDGILGARRETGFNFASRQCDLAVFAYNLSVRPQHDRDVVDQMLVAFDQPRDDV